MSTRAVFSNEFYSDPWLFLKGWRVEKTPEGTILSTDFWGARHLEANVNSLGTVITHSPSFFENLKQRFLLLENPNQIAAHRRLKELEIQLQNPLSPETQALKQEIRNEGIEGARKLQRNLELLNEGFQKNNQKGLFTLTLDKNHQFRSKILQRPVS
jgi:hypothetical protein